MINAFVSGAVTIQFSTPPLREGGDTSELYQATGFASAGTQYVYDKAGICRTTRKIVFPRETDAGLAALLSFATDTVRGAKTPFTWYDHEGVSHAVRLVGTIVYRQTGPNRNRIEIVIEEDVAWSSPATGLGKDAKTGAAPLWILRLTVGGVDYWLSDMTVTVPGWNGGITTKAWVSQWGRVQEGISNALDEFRVADFSLTCLIDPGASPNIEALATGYPLEQSPVELYLWFRGQDAAVNPPVMKFRGYVREVDIPDSTAVSLVVQDETIRLRNYIGTKVDRTTYPSADPDEVGKVIPIVFGTLTKFPALAVDAGKQTTLPANIDAASTSFAVSDAIGLAGGMTIQADDEQMYVSAISGDTVTVVRGYAGTLSGSHLKGAIVWERKAAFTYIVADHPLDAINKVYGKVGEGILDITAICTRYLGSVGNQHPNYPGKACITIPGYVTAAQAVQLLVNAGTWQVLDNVSVTDGIHVYDNISVTDSIHVYDVIAVTAPSDAGHAHTTAKSSNLAASNCPRYLVDNQNLYGVSNSRWVAIAFPGVAGTRANVTYRITVVSHNYATTGNIYIGVGSSIRVTSTSPFNSSSLQSRSYEFTISSDLFADTIYVGMNDINANNYIEVQSASRTIELSDGTVATSAASVTGGGRTAPGTDMKSGSAGRTALGTDMKSGSAGRTATNLPFPTTGHPEIYGNSVANTLVGDSILCDVTRNVTAPGDVVSNILSTYCGVTSFQQTGTFPAGYTINGALTEYRTALEWLNLIAFQCRAWFRMELGTAKLIVRPDALTSVKTIPACRITDDGRRVHSRRKADYADILNKIQILFDRDWALAKGEAAYRGLSRSSNSSSIAIFGERERPELFQFDFVTSQAMADSVRDFYLARYATRPWLHEFEAFLDHSELVFGNGVTLGFAGNVLGEIREAGYAPGSATAMDTVKFTAVV